MASSHRTTETTIDVLSFTYPLKLWLDAPWEIVAPNSYQMIDGEVHFVPPTGQRAQLARKFLHAHATYPHDTEPPSVAQLRRLHQIARLAHTYRAPPPPTKESFELLEALDWYKMLGGE